MNNLSHQGAGLGTHETLGMSAIRGVSQRDGAWGWGKGLGESSGVASLPMWTFVQISPRNLPSPRKLGCWTSGQVRTFPWVTERRGRGAGLTRTQGPGGPGGPGAYRRRHHRVPGNKEQKSMQHRPVLCCHSPEAGLPGPCARCSATSPRCFHNRTGELTLLTRGTRRLHGASFLLDGHVTSLS